MVDGDVTMPVLEKPDHYLVDPARVKVGDIMSFTYYGEVEMVDGGVDYMRLGLKDLHHGVPFSVYSTERVKHGHSADQVSEKRRVNQTQLIDLLMLAYGRPFTVSFFKKDNTERVLRGRLVRVDHARGRSLVEDLEKATGRSRWVYHNKIFGLICDGINYTCPKPRK